MGPFKIIFLVMFLKAPADLNLVQGATFPNMMQFVIR